MAYQSETALEYKLIEQLVSKGYEWVPEVKSEATMVENFRMVLEQRNSMKIGEEPHCSVLYFKLDCLKT